MPTFIVDLEADGLLDTITRVHCLVARDVVTGAVHCFADNPGVLRDPRRIEGTIEDGLEFLRHATWVGHNLVAYDVPALRKLKKGPTPRRPLEVPEGEDADVFDTLIASRLIWTEIKQVDFGMRKRWGLPGNLVGSHSLEAWGFRLGVLKGSFAKKEEWEEFSEAMLDYCVQDTAVTRALYNRILQKNYSSRALWLEHNFADAIDRMQTAGIAYDREAADALTKTLMVRRAELEDLIRAHPTFADFTNHYTTPKRKIAKTKHVLFNPRSRVHLIRALRERCGWVPAADEYTDGGRPEVTEVVLKRLAYPGLDLILEHFTVNKVLGMLAEGKKAWPKFVGPDGRVHGFVNHNGAVSGRCTHSSPNMTQVPKAGVDKATKAHKRGYAGGFGFECRSLFGPGMDGFLQVGCDAQGLELRTLAHYFAKYDDGAYATIVTEGDPHEANRAAAELDTRDRAKTFIYALLYGAAGAKIGKVTGRTEKEGYELIDRFMANMPPLAKLKRDMEDFLIRRGMAHRIRTRRGTRLKVKPGAYLPGLDGRRLMVRSPHSMLSVLNQGAGAIVMKMATVILHRRLLATLGNDWIMMLHVHDEYQFAAREFLAETLGREAADAIRQAGVALSVRCPLAGEYKVGKTWAETH